MDELARLRFARKAQDVFGDEEAAYLMDHLPYGGVADIATNTGIGHLRSDMVSEFAAVRSDMVSEFAAVRSDMDSEFAAVRTEMASEFAAVRTEMKLEFAAVRTEMASEFAVVRSEMRELRSDLRAEFHSELRRFTVMNVSLMTGLISAMGTVLGILIVAVN